MLDGVTGHAPVARPTGNLIAVSLRGVRLISGVPVQALDTANTVRQ